MVNRWLCMQRYEITFHLLGIKWHTSAVEFQAPPGASRPTVEKGGAPHIAGDSGATASVAFEVDERGNPSNVRVEKASDEAWAREAVAAIEKWKFSPAMKDGNPISVPVKMTFVRQD